MLRRSSRAGATWLHQSSQRPAATAAASKSRTSTPPWPQTMAMPWASLSNQSSIWPAEAGSVWKGFQVVSWGFLLPSRFTERMDRPAWWYWRAVSRTLPELIADWGWTTMQGASLEDGVSEK